MRSYVFPGASTPGPAAMLALLLLASTGFVACSDEDADDEGDVGSNDVADPEDTGDATGSDASDIAESDAGADTSTPPDTDEEDASDAADASDGSATPDTADAPDVVAAVCGNGVLEEGESCDGEVLEGQTCDLEGFDGGDLACSESCLVDTSGCFNAVCGDGTCNGGETFDVCRADCLPHDGFALVVAGTFTAGSPEDENGRLRFDYQRQVTLTRDFLLQTTEVSQAEWTELSGGINPSCFQSATEITCSTANANPEAPVETVDWYSAVAYANALSARDGLTECYELIDCTDLATGWQDGLHSGCTDATFLGLDCDGYRLPTEGEWEYAARAGTTTATPLGNLEGDANDCAVVQTALDPIAWYCGNSPDRTQPVGTKAPNAWGFYDLHGNVAEWTSDRFDRTFVPADETDPLGASTGNERVIKSSGYSDTARFARSGYREGFLPESRAEGIGLRVARTLP